MGGRRWSDLEIAYLKDNAGMLTEREIARRLRRSEASVAQMVHRLSEGGMLNESGRLRSSARAWRSEARECPECHMMRYRFMRNGTCAVCHQERHVERYREGVEELVSKLPDGKRDDALSLDIDSKPLPAPPKRPYRGDYERTVFDEYRYKRDSEEYERAMEDRRLTSLNREWDALRRRKKTIKGWIE